MHGAIRDKYKDLGWEAGLLGYPISNETKTPDNVGRFSVPEGLDLLVAGNRAHEVHGTIRDKYKELGWEAGRLGYPTSDEYPVATGQRSDFQHGSITFDVTTKTATATFAK